MEELKDRYEIIEEAASDAIVTLDAEGKILSYQPGCRAHVRP
jgi:hypothetical protein